MPFIAECLFCHAKVRVPDESEGMSVTCPRCGDSFTLAPMANQPKVTAQQLRSPPTAATAAATVLATVHDEAKVDPGTPPPVIAPLEEWRRPWIFPYELIGGLALLLAGLGMAASPLPECQTIAAVLGGSALVAGIAGCVVGGKPDRGGRLKPAVAGLIGGAVLAVAMLWPDLFGGGPPFGDNTPRPFGREVASERAEDAADAAEPIGPAVCTFRFGTLRVAVQTARAGTLKFTEGVAGPPERGLQICLRIANGNTDSPLAYRGWSWPVPGDKSSVAALFDDGGKRYKLRVAGTGRDVAGQVREMSIPSHSRADDVLVFELPDTAVRSLRLELPLTAVGATGTARLEIPWSSVIFLQP